jgi:hypothetical protein
MACMCTRLNNCGSWGQLTGTELGISRNIEFQVDQISPGKPGLSTFTKNGNKKACYLLNY